MGGLGVSTTEDGLMDGKTEESMLHTREVSINVKQTLF